jgi:c-di-GMP-binding flagellar brake protein YcgR
MDKNDPLNISKGKDSRKFRRLRVNLSVIYRIDRPSSVRMLIGNREIRATMLDLSEGGLSLLTNYNIPVQSVLLLKFTLFKVENDDVSFYGPMSIDADVRYNIPLGGDEYRVGVRFIKIKNQDKFEIANFIKYAPLH